MKFGWLHLSDFHQGVQRQDELFPQIQEKLYEDLKKTHAKHGPWDIIVFTGDIANTGDTQEFATFDTHLEAIRNQIKLLQSDDPFFLAVPGNHDLIYPKPNEAILELFADWQNRDNFRDVFWNNADSRQRKLVEKAFTPYNHWWQPHAERLPNYHKGLLPGDFSATIEKNGAKIAVLGLNTAFLQLTKGDYEEKLALHAKQFHAACGGDGVAWAKQHHACLLLTHHPASWLDKESRQHLFGEIRVNNRFFIHLHGHGHRDETDLTSFSAGGEPLRHSFQASSLFGLTYCKGNFQRTHGYAAGSLDLAGQNAQLRIWPRKTKVQKYERRFVPDYSIDLDDDDHGSKPIVVPLLNFYHSDETLGSGNTTATVNQMTPQPSDTVPNHLPMPASPTAITFREKLREGARKEVEKWLENSDEFPAGIIPARVEGSNKELVEEVEAWLASDGPAVGLLSGPLGAGKTVASLEVWQALQTPLSANNDHPIDLWIPFRDNRFFEGDPENAILQRFGVSMDGDLWGKEAGVRCVIFDGIDEFISRAGRGVVLTWLNAFLNHISKRKSPPKLLFVGRDVVMERQVMDSEFRDRLINHCIVRHKKLGKAPQPIEWRLRAGDNNFWREELKNILIKARIDNSRLPYLMSLVSQVDFSSPLLFRLAVDVLLKLAPNSPEAIEITNDWELKEFWVQHILACNNETRPGQTEQQKYIPYSDRAIVAKVIALYLALTGRGMLGATLPEFAGYEWLQSVWSPIKELEFSGIGIAQEKTANVADIANELKLGAILRAHGDRLAPFHQSILIHLAAGALQMLADGSAPGSPPSDTGAIIDEDEKILLTWRRAGTISGIPGLANIGQEINRTVGHEALHADSLLEEVLRYWGKHDFSKRMGESGRQAKVQALNDLLLSEFEGTSAFGAAVIFNNAVVRPISAPQEASLQTAKHLRQQLLSKLQHLPAQHILQSLYPIPAGSYRVWRKDAQGNRYPAAIAIDSTVFLARNLCSVSEYAEYLAATSDAPLPDQPMAKWSRNGVSGEVQFNSAMADEAVTGVSLDEAQSYCRWLTLTSPFNDKDKTIPFCLPKADWLRIAAWGPHLGELAPNGSGPFEQVHLTGYRGQWTEDLEATTALVFGGNETLGSQQPGDAQRALSQFWPDLCQSAHPRSRNPMIGFRISLQIHHDDAQDGDYI